MSARFEPHTSEGAVHTYRRMLVLDDDAGVSRTVVLMAKRLGIQAEACSTLATFEEKLLSFQPDVLLIDLMMPDVDGIDAISRIRPHCEAPIYVMSGADKRTYEASRGVLRSSTVPIAGFLHKPFSVGELRDTLNRASEEEAASYPVRRDSYVAAALSPVELEDFARRGKMVPFFQPIMDATTRSLKGFEALLRVDGQGESALPAACFEHLANDKTLSALVTDVVIERSLRFLTSVSSDAEPTISINVFARDAVADGFREYLVEKCSLLKVAPARVILELSEATICECNEADMRNLTQLRLAGFGLSIDDFGTGNSSLSRLAKLPCSELKIDKSFCLGLPESDSAEAIIEACLGIARKLDMMVTAEGIESGEVADILTKMGCDALQGYYFGPAMPDVVAADWMKRGCPLVGG